MVLDRLMAQGIQQLDAGLRALFPPTPRVTTRPSPAQDLPEAPLTQRELSHVTGLMRVNHCGEICAQALYHGQALVAKSENLHQHFLAAAAEEADHLAWCEARLRAMGGSVSVLNPLWYIGSWALGVGMGCLGEALSLGFVMAVEAEVEAHLASHLAQLPVADAPSKAVLTQMQEDERHHAQQALGAGGWPFPPVVRRGMRCVASVMTTASYYV